MRGLGDVGGERDGRCRRRAAKKDPTSSERALRNCLLKAVKTEICLSEASLFPFRRKKAVLAREGAVLIFASFHQGKEGATLHKGRSEKEGHPSSREESKRSAPHSTREKGK